MQIAQRMKKILPSPTLKANDQAKALQAAGQNISMLTLGQPDFATPENVRQVASKALELPDVGFYTATRGMPKLISAIKGYFARFYGLRYENEQLLVTTGAKFALYATMQVLLNPNDGALIPVPYWSSYVDQVKLADGVPQLVPTSLDHGYKVTVEDLEQVYTNRSRVLILNSPSNPTGMIYTKKELTAIGEWALAHDLIIIADDIYGRLVYNDATFTSIAQISPEIKDITLVINGLSKAYAMPGWRVGFVAGSTEIISEMLKIVSQATSNITTVSQYAAIEAIEGDQSSVEVMRKSFEERLNILYPLVTEIPGFNLTKPEGAFYFFPNIEETLRLTHYQNSTEFCQALLNQAQVAVVAGSAFGMDHNLRISYATELDLVIEAIEKIKNFVEKSK